MKPAVYGPAHSNMLYSRYQKVQWHQWSQPFMDESAGEGIIFGLAIP